MNNIWNTFEQNIDSLKNEFKEDNFIASSGIEFNELKKACFAIAKSKSLSVVTKRANIISYIMENARISLNYYGWFADRVEHGGIIHQIRQLFLKDLYKTELKQIQKVQKNQIQDRAFWSGEDFGHTCPDFEAVLNLGITGIIKRLEEAQKNLPEKSEFFSTSIQVHRSMLILISRFADQAKKASKDHPKMELVSNALTNLIKGAPTDILEAMQLLSIYFFWQSYIEGTIARSLGRLDELLLPFYEKDIESGKYSKEQITELFKHFMYRFYAADIIANVPFAIGGINTKNNKRDEFGKLILDTYSSLNITSPKLHIRVCENTENSYLNKVFSSIKSGNNSFVFTNDNAVVSSLINIGIEKSEAENYVMIGCYEPAAFKKEVPCTCNGQISLPKAVEYAITGGIDLFSKNKNGAKTSIPTTYDEFINNLKIQIKHLCDNAIKRVCEFEKNYLFLHSSPIFSSTLEECVSQGKDAYEGGAKYNNSSLCAIGLANAANSIFTIKKLVFEDKTLTIAKLCKILKKNWKGHEKLRFKIKNLPKYGNNVSKIDSIASDLLHISSEYINNIPNARGGVFRLGAFSIDWRESFGKTTAASADGRLKGEYLSKNLSASVAEDKEGVTALISSAGKLDYKNIPNGAVIDILLYPSSVKGDAGNKAMLALVKSYFKMGGMAIQFNIFDPSVLRKAQAEPHKYATLQVRLCGWNVYFVDLEKEVQDEFILQAENNL
jgi:formate C-acetyltransferase